MKDTNVKSKIGLIAGVIALLFLVLIGDGHIQLSAQSKIKENFRLNSSISIMENICFRISYFATGIEEESLYVLQLDVEPPTIEGISTIYATVGDSISYRKNIQLLDNSGGDVSLEIDSSDVDTSTPGTYTITYQATDLSGNVTTVEAEVVIEAAIVPSEASLTPYLDEIIANTTTPEMSKYDKAYALWNWCRNNIRYSYSSGNRSSIWHGVYEGVYKRYGDCYAYYATYSALLTRCGIDNLCVARVNGTSNHWWNLVNVGDGWYHCDTSPRSKGDSYLCFMQTDAQVAAYTESHVQKPNYYTFDPSLYPERATTIIFGN